MSASTPKKAAVISAFITVFLLSLSSCDLSGIDLTPESTYIPVTTAADTAKQAETETEAASHTVYVCGKEFSSDAEELVFSGGEIKSLAGITDKLSEFKNLRSVDLGTFEISVFDAEALKRDFGGIDFRYTAYVPLYGSRIKTTETEIDLSGKDITDLTELSEALPYLPSVTRVYSTDGITSYENKKDLAERFPEVTFSFDAVCDIYGRSVVDSAALLDLKGLSIGDDLAEKLKMFPRLEAVDLHLTDVSAEQQSELVKAFPEIRFLWDVAIGGQSYDSGVGDLDLTGTQLDTGAVRAFIPLFYDLGRIDLSDCGMQNEELAQLRTEFPDIKIVWRLYMGKWSLKTDAVAFSVLIYDYDYTRLTSEDIEVLKYCTDLQALDLGHQAITDLSVIGDHLTDLRVLILVDNKLSDLSPLSKLRHLHYLEIFVNRRVKDISPLGECKELVDLNVSYLYDLRDITALLGLPLLERLWIEHTDVSEKDIKRLKEAHPDATVIDVGEGSVDQGWREHPRYKAMFDMFKKTNYISEEFTKYDLSAS